MTRNIIVQALRNSLPNGLFHRDNLATSVKAAVRSCWRTAGDQLCDDLTSVAEVSPPRHSQVPCPRSGPPVPAIHEMELHPWIVRLSAACLLLCVLADLSSGHDKADLSTFSYHPISEILHDVRPYRVVWIPVLRLYPDENIDRCC